jgi:hypothetical protein
VPLALELPGGQGNPTACVLWLYLHVLLHLLGPTCISYRRLTPVVVSSETPTMFLAMRVQRVGSLDRPSRMMRSTILNSWLSVLSGSGRVPSLAKAASALTPSVTIDKRHQTNQVR